MIGGMKSIPVKNFFIGKGYPLVIFAGPCVIESESMALSIAEQLAQLFQSFSAPFIFKASYDKANRSSFRSFRGPGLKEGLRILKKIKTEFQIPVVTDVHSVAEVEEAAAICDILQIPAFLCRQTDLICTAAQTGIPIKIKKGQFMAPWDMKNVVEKVLEMGNAQILLTERGTSFGYNNLICDMRSILWMQDLGVPVCFDASHSTQLPGGNGDRSGGEKRFIPPLARAALAAGCDSLFFEVHPDPEQAKSDRETQLSPQELALLLKELYPLHRLCSLKQSE
jgi:2-dehydro-3-deoxyphosphooctonate aldolase (KDO 8-P synthase)